MALDGGLTERVYGFRPDLPVFREDGTYSYSGGMSLENPVALSQARNKNNTLLLLLSAYGELEVVNDLVFKSLLSLNYNHGTQNSYYPKCTFRGGWARTTGDGNGYAQESQTIYSNITWENSVRYHVLLGDSHRLATVAGVSFEQTRNTMTKAWGEGFFNPALSNVSSATVSNGGGATRSNSGLLSYFGRVNYDYDDRYLVNVSARVDGSSKFAVDNKYAFFPAVSLGWRISGEEFMKDVAFVNELKLRGSCGLTGQQDFGPYQWRTLYETSDYGGMPSVTISQLGNDRLKWEKSWQYDVGLNFELFNSRVSGEIGFYIKDTGDAIFNMKPPGNTGFNATLANVGDTRNKGVEFEARVNLARGKDFSWDVSLNFTRNRNSLTRINDDYKDADGYITGIPGNGGRLKVGMPIGLIWGYKYEKIFDDDGEIQALNTASPTGVYQNAATSRGDLMFADINGPDGVPDGVVNTYDQTVIGNSQPDLFGGFGSAIEYKGFSLSAFFTYSLGNDLEWFQQTRSINFANNTTNENKLTSIKNAWTEERPTGQPRLVYGDPNQNARLSSYYVHDASYIRLKNVYLGYTASPRVIKGIKWLNARDLMVYVAMQNWLTFTSYPGADPEAANLYNNDISTGRDNNKFPVAKVFSVGLKLHF
jgi:TonB-linked SusC/RagA family outer membrane protein